MPIKHKELKIGIDIPERIKSGQNCSVNVEIENVSNESVIINKRLAIGYQNSLSRELYVVIYHPDSTENVGIQKVLYERSFALQADFVSLKPGEKILTHFNLFDWYEFPQSGKYDLVVCYQADEELAYKPDGLVQGTFCSARKAINFNPGD